MILCHFIPCLKFIIYVGYSITQYCYLSQKRGMKDQYTAPVFRSRPDIKHGFISGGFWKYSTKPSNILLPDEEIVNSKNEERTIQDDNVVAGQDVAAGLVRMGILPRLCCLLEVTFFTLWN